MNYGLLDCAGLAAASLLSGVLLLLPGLALAQTSQPLFGAPGNSHTSRSGPKANDRLGFALVLACALLPVADALLARLAGLDLALAAHLAATVASAAILLRHGFPGLPSRGVISATAAWAALVAFLTVDIDWNGGLISSLLMLDMTKHAGTVRAIVEAGQAPPSDIFFNRPEAAGYYYFFYVLPAFVERLGFGLIDPRAAIGAQIIWTGLALLALIRLTLITTGLGTRKAHMIAALAILGCAGLEVLGATFLGATANIWFGQICWWKESVGSFFHDVVWVPHHVTALIAGWLGLLVMARAIDPRCVDSSHRAGAVAVAGMAFASTIGLSVWIALAVALAAMLWLSLLAAAGRWHDAATLTAAGLLAAILAAGPIIDILANRAPGPFPVAISLRSLPVIEANVAPGIARTALALVLVPFNIAVEFGILLVGVVLLAGGRRWARVTQSEAGRLCVVAAITGLLASFLLRSTLVNNDLGWRVLMLAQLPFVVITAARAPAFARLMRRQRKISRDVPPLAAAAAAALLIGYAGTVYDMVGLRAGVPLSWRGLGPAPRDAAVTRDVRLAYDWAAREIPHDRIVQHSPHGQLWFGLYGRFPVAASDPNLVTLFGADRTQAQQRLDDLSVLFSADADVGTAMLRARRHNIHALLVTSHDAVWLQPTSWVWRLKPAYAGAHVRLFVVPDRPDQIAAEAPKS